MAFVNAILNNPGIDVQTRLEALKRVHADPGIPDAFSTTSSFWLKEPHPKIAKSGSANLPPEAQIVIIGSGITGVSVARTLLEHYDKSSLDSTVYGRPRVLMLDARDVCSGATGRNGGHILETAEEYPELKEAYGKDSAIKILKFRLAHLKIMMGVAKEHNIAQKSQARELRFLSVYFDQESWAAAKSRIEEFKTDLPNEASEWETVEASRMSQELHLSRAVGAVSGPAGAIWPYKFVTLLLEQLLRDHPSDFVIESNTPVSSISKRNGKYQVTTPRGTVSCTHVVHCTNAHVTHLVPGLRGHIYPIRGQMSAQSPGSNFPFQGAKHSWIFNYKEGFDYLTQLPCDGQISNGELMMGGGFAQTEGGGITEIGLARDDDLNLLADVHLSGVLSAVFGREQWGSVSGPSVKSMWTGNMSFSSDLLPWVGKLPDSLTLRKAADANQTKDQAMRGSEWVAAGFSGEGMVNCWLSGNALAIMLLSQEGAVDAKMVAEMQRWFPEEMAISDERLKRSFIPVM